jgi:hypothetical protein
MIQIAFDEGAATLIAVVRFAAADVPRIERKRWKPISRAIPASVRLDSRRNQSNAFNTSSRVKPGVRCRSRKFSIRSSVAGRGLFAAKELGKTTLGTDKTVISPAHQSWRSELQVLPKRARTKLWNVFFGSNYPLRIKHRIPMLLY